MWGKNEVLECRRKNGSLRRYQLSVNETEDRMLLHGDCGRIKVVSKETGARLGDVKCEAAENILS